MSNTACATSALSSSERFTDVTSFCVMTPSRFTSRCVTHPKARSMGRTSVVSDAISAPVAGRPGLKSPPMYGTTAGVGAAWMYATTMVFASPGFSWNGPELSKKRVSANCCDRKQ